LRELGTVRRARSWALALSASAAVASVFAGLSAVGFQMPVSAAGVATPAPPFTVLSRYPTRPDANGASTIQIRFSTPVDPRGALPTIDPAIAGTWKVQGDLLSFQPDGAFAPGSIVTVRVPGGPGGVRSVAGRALRRRVVWRYGTEPGSLLRAEQILSQLGYLPITFTPVVRAVPTLDEAEREVYFPPSGSFKWAWDAPPTLRQLWQPGRPTVLVTGALDAFESRHELPVTGGLDPQVWSALVTAARHPYAWRDTTGYTYALADKNTPETLTVWHDDKVLLVSPANTGGALTPTEDGSFPVYERLASQIMSGFDPDGTPYADPVAWVAYFNGGDAVHYIARDYYGSPQSLGCVELPYTQAEQVWPYLTIGSVVTVEG
jgi:hypothetical protein